MFILQILILLIVFVVFIPLLVVLIQTLFFVFSKKHNGKAQAIHASTLKTVLLMPAHNEALVIEKTLLSIQPHLSENTSLLVVADNCSDDTANIARRFGANVLERSDLSNRGKGFALDFGIQFMKQNPPDIVIIVDADCIMSENSIATLIYQCELTHRPIQALYLMESETRKTRIAEFAWRIKNYVRPLGWHFIGGPCQLMGSGMAFPWNTIVSADLANGNIVEDMKLGIELTKIGSAPIFCDQAKVTSFFPTSNEGIHSQRTRWEHGHLSTIINEVPALLVTSVRTRNFQALLLALDLLVPPLTLLLLLSIMCGFIGSVVGLLSSFSFLLEMSSALLLSFLLFFMVSWFYQGRDLIDKTVFYSLIGYIFKKIPLYIKFLVNKQVDWVRSKRD